MDRAEALHQLPSAYGLILRLNDLGADVALMSDCLGIELEAVGPMLEVAQGKLAALLGGRDGAIGWPDTASTPRVTVSRDQVSPGREFK